MVREGWLLVPSERPDTVRRAELTEIPWSKLEHFDNLIVYEAWQALPEERRRQVQVILQDINELADERGLSVLAQAGRLCLSPG